MSGEYYSNRDNVTTIYQGHAQISPKPDKPGESPQQSYRLQEIEHQLEMAESRCTTLKDQLDYMKQMYCVKKAAKIRKISNIEPANRNSDEAVSLSSVSTCSADKKIYPKRQNSNAIGTDNSGAAVRTINNILNGITNSVNRLSELHVQITDTPRTKKVSSTGSTPREISTKHPFAISPPASSALESRPETKQTIISDCGGRVSKRSKNIKKRLKDSKTSNKKTTSHQLPKRAKPSERSIKVSNTRSSLVPKHSSSLQKKIIINRSKPNVQSLKLVELYHNIAAKQSNSDELHLSRNSKRTFHREPTQVGEEPAAPEPKPVPPLNIKEKLDGIVRLPQCQSRMTCQILGMGEGDYEPYEPLEAPRSCYQYTKNYELPTIASKMKQVAKCYLNTFNFKAIPFCAAISTTPSHNIGINIQQVMNIIKNRQPVNGISPTLAHNIGLAAERLHSRPLSALVSTITSKTYYRPSQCPLSKSLVNYQQLQDMAKGIPEETAEDVEEEADSPDVKTIVITGPSGDMEVKNRNVPVWTADSTKLDHCTCVNQSGTDLQHVVSKYASKKCTTPATCYTPIQKDKRWQRPTKLGSRKSIAKTVQSKCQNGHPTAAKFETVPIHGPEIEEESPLQGKERNLKDVLTNLHNDFEALNKRYEDLSQKTCADDKHTIKELEVLENELNKKEEEITMVMTLYKEVLALKRQVKTLKQKTSQASVCQEPREVSVNFKDYNNPEAAFHLTKLLKQIHIYQNKYKKDGCKV